MQELLGETKPEIERKFLVRTTKKAPDNLEVITAFIVQDYLKNSEKGVTERVRLSSDGFVDTYTHTHKRRISAGVHDETERVITKEEYGKLLSRANSKLNTIHKTRYTFTWDGMVWELDKYAGRLSGLVVLEIELEDINTPVTIPPFIEVEREVTEDRSYSNRALAER